MALRRRPSFRTAWHPMLVELLRLVLPQRGWEVLPEVPLAKEPLRLDVLVIRRAKGAALPTLLRPEVARFGKYTLVHFVSPSDDLEADDALALLAYGCQFVRLHHHEGPEVQTQVVLFVVCSSLTPRYHAALERLEGRLARTEEGLWQGVVAGFRLEVVETSKRSKHPREHLWRTVSKAFLEDSTGGIRLDDEEMEICRQLNRHVQRFEEQGDALMADEMMKITKSYRATLKRWMEECLPVEDRLAGLTPEQRLSGLAPEQRLAGLAPEQRTAGLGPAEVVLALPDAALRALSADYVATLPADVQKRIKARLKAKPAATKRPAARRSPAKR